jgi:hypothetical protein
MLLRRREVEDSTLRKTSDAFGCTLMLPRLEEFKFPSDTPKSLDSSLLGRLSANRDGSSVPTLLGPPAWVSAGQHVRRCKGTTSVKRTLVRRH